MHISRWQWDLSDLVWELVSSASGIQISCRQISWFQELWTQLPQKFRQSPESLWRLMREALLIVLLKVIWAKWRLTAWIFLFLFVVKIIVFINVALASAWTSAAILRPSIFHWSEIESTTWAELVCIEVSSDQKTTWASSSIDQSRVRLVLKTPSYDREDRISKHCYSTGCRRRPRDVILIGKRDHEYDPI